MSMKRKASPAQIAARAAFSARAKAGTLRRTVSKIKARGRLRNIRRGNRARVRVSAIERERIIGGQFRAVKGRVRMGMKSRAGARTLHGAKKPVRINRAYTKRPKSHHVCAITAGGKRYYLANDRLTTAASAAQKFASESAALAAAKKLARLPGVRDKFRKLIAT